MGEVRVKGGKINSAMDQFTPNCYVEVGTSGILAKIEALRMYRGVMRPYPHPRSEEYITGLAAFRGKRTGYGGLFTSDNPVYIYGDLMSLVCDANYEPLRSLTATNAFKESFKGRTNIDIDPEKELVLSAETVGTSGYLSMFEGCTSLTVPPDMSKMKTVESGNWNSGTNGDGNAQKTYGGCLNMFKGCTSLTSLPDLSGLQTVEGYGMYRMFFQCTGLTSVPAGLLSGVTQFEQGSFFGMFESCSSLTSIRCLATNSKSINATDKWLQKAKNTAECTFYKKAGAVWKTGTNGIPDKWNVVEVD